MICEIIMLFACAGPSRMNLTQAVQAATVQRKSPLSKTLTEEEKTAQLYFSNCKSSFVALADNDFAGEMLFFQHSYDAETKALKASDSQGSQKPWIPTSLRDASIVGRLPKLTNGVYAFVASPPLSTVEDVIFNHTDDFLSSEDGMISASKLSPGERMVLAQECLVPGMVFGADLAGDGSHTYIRATIKFICQYTGPNGETETRKITSEPRLPTTNFVPDPLSGESETTGGDQISFGPKGELVTLGEVCQYLNAHGYPQRYFPPAGLGNYIFAKGSFGFQQLADALNAAEKPVPIVLQHNSAQEYAADKEKLVRFFELNGNPDLAKVTRETAEGQTPTVTPAEITKWGYLSPVGPNASVILNSKGKVIGGGYPTSRTDTPIRIIGGELEFFIGSMQINNSSANIIALDVGF